MTGGSSILSSSSEMHDSVNMHKPNLSLFSNPFRAQSQDMISQGYSSLQDVKSKRRFVTLDLV